MDTVDPRTRHKVSLNPAALGAKSTLLPQALLSDALVVLALQAGKASLFSIDVGVFWVLVRFLACGATGLMIWVASTGQLQKKRSIEVLVSLGMASLLLFLRQAGLTTALYRLPASRVVIIHQFSAMWFKSLIAPSSLLQTCAVVAALSIAFLSDSGLSSEGFHEMLPAYGALLVEAGASSALDHTQSVLLPSLGEPMSMALSTLGASIFSFPLYLLRHVMTDVAAPPSLSLTSLAVVPFLAYVLLFRAPQTSKTTKSPAFPPQYYLFSYPLVVLTSLALGLFSLGRYPRLSDFLIAPLLLYGVYPRTADLSGPSPYASSSRVIKAYLKSILSNPTIHMAFDCMAIGVGLIASVMARWPPNERFTYGYGRIETLSGFANGIFLVLISFFIIFEAIQRLYIGPPEMNTNQLLLVSSLGLGVNLFGMFAMGGHHHHGGHSHSHGHGHSHGDAPSPSPSTSSFGEHAHEHEDHSHSHVADEVHHSHDHSHDDHAHSHSHDDDHHSHSHSHAHTDSCAHDHSDATLSTSHPSEAHAHSHSQSHSPPPLSITPPDRHIPAPLINITTSDSPSSAHPHSHSHSHAHGPPSPLQDNELLLPIPKHLRLGEADSPLTPSYRFGHDPHFETHHTHASGSGHAPNLHDHSHEHHAHEGHSHNMRGVFLHVMADTLGSVGVIASTLLIKYYGWTGFDPIASLFIAILIAASVIPLLPTVEGLASYTRPRFWPKDDSGIIGSIHIQLAPSASSHDPAGPHSTRRTTFTNVDRVVERVDKLLRSRISGLEELTIQVEES
ncbi:cation efflux family-domain-containing protein [Fomitopsis serialis]|uniref:cation efflux family-domain-containing protein n=1 Tax=Fomitopsis serialis TaxID=139415 RepID=UPI002007B98A|nr:cation efflux family-domain-containing protein [Neoantrodia serialis]KAH9933332.1 cation efflux family-domain-containing protein [Neoantrodia serialis]